MMNVSPPSFIFFNLTRFMAGVGDSHQQKITSSLIRFRGYSHQKSPKGKICHEIAKRGSLIAKLLKQFFLLEKTKFCYLFGLR